MHSPFFPPVEKWGENKRELYLAVLEEMDRQLAPLFDYVRGNSDLRENTLILICSDNGHEPGAGEAGILKGCKTNLYEGGIRSSLIVWGPGLVNREAVGTRNKTSVFAAIDFLPSLLKLTGAKAPVAVTFDGEEILNTLLGKSETSRKAPIYFSRPPDRKDFYGFTNLPDLAVRNSQWKLLCDYDGSRPNLFNIITDPGESTNRAGEYPEITNDLVKKVTTWYQSMPSNQ